MKQKTVKQPLTAAEVTANLHRLFGRTDCQCTDVFQVDVWGTKYTHFAMSFPRHDIIVDGFKKVYQVATPREVQEYERYSEYNGVMVTKEINGKVCIPYNYIKDKALKEHGELALMACGLKKEISDDDDVKRLRKLAGPQYVNIYKMLQGVTILSAKMNRKESKDFRGNVINVWYGMEIEYGNGNCNISLDITSNEEDNVEIRNIFCSLVGLPISSRVEMQEAA